MSTRIAIVPSTLLRLGVGALGLAAVGVLVVQGSEAAFTASTTNTGNSVTAGTVVLTDSDAGTALFSIDNLNHGEVLTRCITVTYSGSLVADVKLHADVTNPSTTLASLAPGLVTEVRVGSSAKGSPFFSCADFIPAGTAPGIFSGTLEGLGAKTDYATGLEGFNDAVAGDKRTYEITMKVTDLNKNDYQGLSAGVDFTWEAQGENVTRNN